MRHAAEELRDVLGVDEERCHIGLILYMILLQFADGDAQLGKRRRDEVGSDTLERLPYKHHAAIGIPIKQQ